MERNNGTDGAPQHRHLVLVDAVTILISVFASLAIRFGTLAITPYVQRIRFAIILLVLLRLSLFAVLGLYRPIQLPFTRREVLSLVGAVILSSSITALLVLGLAFPLGLVNWFPRSLLIIELLPGIILAGVVRVVQWVSDTEIGSKHRERLQAIRSRAGRMVSIVFIALMAVLSWQALSLAAGLLPRDWASFLSGIPLIILSAILFLLPGYALLAVLRPRIGLDVLEGLIVSAGLSVAIIPLLLFFCSLAGLELNTVSVGAIFVLLGALALWRSLPQLKPPLAAVKGRCSGSESRTKLNQARSLFAKVLTEACMFYAALAMIFLMALLVRLWVVKDLWVGMWADSYHHTMISQLLVDNGGLFSSWEPYAPLSSFTYHFGFHALVAFYHWLTGVPVIKSVVLVGQITNALAVPLVYLLAKRLTDSRWAGLVAAVIVGFLSSMPMYYVNWGRYTQLAGQTILPIAMLFGLDSLLRKGWNWRSIVVTLVALAGLILTHYRVTLMYLGFLLTVLLFRTYEASRAERKREAWGVWLRAFVTAAAATILVSPWIWNLKHGLLPYTAAATIASGPSLIGVTYIQEAIENGFILFVVGRAGLVLSILGAVLGVLQRKRPLILMSAWVAGLLFAAVLFPVPGGTPAHNVATVLIALYIPASILSGSFLSYLLRVARSKAPLLGRAAIAATLLIVLGAHPHMLMTLNPDMILLTKPDEQAMDWIACNTDQNAKFLINSWFWSEMFLGSDGGWWIPLLAGRQTTVPPMMYATEASFDPHYALQVGEFNRTVHNSALDDTDTLQLLSDNRVTHVYVGERGGNLQPEVLVNSSCYDVAYHERGVWIFQVIYACSG